MSLSSGDLVLANERITFDEPPIREVALGRTFLSRPDFLIPYFGVFWARIRDRYPTAQHAQPIIDPSTVDEAAFSPRILFVTSDSRSLVQLQQNRFHYNWRQTDVPVEYVRFPAIKNECASLWREFDAFVLEMTGRPLQPLKAELTYTNFVDATDGATSFNLAELALHDSCWSEHGRFLKAPKAFSHNYVFDLPDGKSSLQASVTAVHRKGANNEKVEALKIELTVRGPCGSEDSFEEWSDGAHDFLVNAFKDLTTPEMHRRWKLRGNDGQ